MSDEKKYTAWNSTLSPGKPLERKTPLNPINRRRRNQRRADQYGPLAYGNHIRSLPCVVGEGCGGPTEAAHVKSRGAGGGPEHMVPMCKKHHREQHTVGIQTFQDRYEIDLDLEAALTWQNYYG